MKVLAFSAWKGSGKDMLASYLIEKHGATRISFADPLKDMAAEEYNIDRAALDEPMLKERPILSLPVDPKDAFSKMLAEFLFKEFRTEKGKQAPSFTYDQQGNFVGDFGAFQHQKLYWTPRALAILKGSTNRTVRSDYWVYKAIEKAKKVDSLVVISDLRYKSEMVQMRQAFKDSLTTIRVERFDVSPSEDPSERDLDTAEFNYRINNRGTKEQAFEQLENLLFPKKEGPGETPSPSDKTE